MAERSRRRHPLSIEKWRVIDTITPSPETLAKRADEKRQARNKWFQDREAADPAFKLGRRMAGAVRASLAAKKSRRSWHALVGYTADDLRVHLERQFEPGMSWENYGDWHIDHIVPLSSFEITGPDCSNFRAAWALSNLRPLWKAENLSKRDSRRHLL